MSPHCFAFVHARSLLAQIYPGSSPHSATLSVRLPSDPQTYLEHMRAAKKAEERVQRAEGKAAKIEAKRQEELRSYNRLMKEENMVSNKEIAAKYQSVEEMEDDFM